VSPRHHRSHKWFSCFGIDAWHELWHACHGIVDLSTLFVEQWNDVALRVLCKLDFVGLPMLPFVIDVHAHLGTLVYPADAEGLQVPMSFSLCSPRARRNCEANPWYSFRFHGCPPPGAAFTFSSPVGGLARAQRNGCRLGRSKTPTLLINASKLESRPIAFCSAEDTCCRPRDRDFDATSLQANNRFRTLGTVLLTCQEIVGRRIHRFRLTFD
jgi:hypothetical protein